MFIWKIVQIVIALLLADFLSGVLHWFQDRYCQRHWPILGKVFVEPNELHHAHPRHFIKDDFFVRNWACFAVAGILLFLFISTHSLSWFTVSFVVASSVLPTQAHYWAHRTCKENGKLISFLQKIGCIQSTQQHWRHHRGSKNNYFCTMTNYVNPILEYFQFFQRLEKYIYIVLRVKPHTN